MHFPRVFVTISTASLIALGGSLAFSQRQAAGESQRQDQDESRPQSDDTIRKGVMLHGNQANPQEHAKAEVTVEDAGVQTGYSNFCRVTATPEEVILDFGVNMQPFAAGPQQVKVGQRVATNFFTAKRLMVALESTIRRHEQTFGPIELDVRRRAKGSQQPERGGELKK